MLSAGSPFPIMSCHVAADRAAATPVLRLRAHPLKVVLVGNPNVGKSVIFGRLTGRYATVSNYPGTTVGISAGRARVGAEVCDLVDSPGVNVLEGVLSEDEQVTRRVLANREAEVVVQVADARNLRRALMLTAQIGAFGLPMVLVLNMVDEARRHGIEVDAARLAAELGVPVVETVAVEGRGLDDLRHALPLASTPRVPFDPAGDHSAWANDAAERFRLRRPSSIGRFQELIGQAVRTPLTGLPILAVVLYVVYLFVGVFGAQTLVNLIEHRLFAGVHQPAGRQPRRALRSVGSGSRLPRRPVRPHHDGPDLLAGHRPAGRRDLLPDLRVARGQRLHSAPGDLLRPDLPRDGAQRQGRAADGARPGLRHDGDDDDADPRDAEGAADCGAAARARHPVLGAARHDPRNPGRHLVRGAADAVRRGRAADVPGRIPRRAGAARGTLGLHHGAAADAGAGAPEPAVEDDAARALVPLGSRAALPGRERRYYLSWTGRVCWPG